MLGNKPNGPTSWPMLHNTLNTVREQLETANLVKQAIGDPVAAIALIDNGLFLDSFKTRESRIR